MMDVIKESVYTIITIIVLLNGVILINRWDMKRRNKTNKNKKIYQTRNVYHKTEYKGTFLSNANEQHNLNKSSDINNSTLNYVNHLANDADLVSTNDIGGVTINSGCYELDRIMYRLIYNKDAYKFIVDEIGRDSNEIRRVGIDFLNKSAKYRELDKLWQKVKDYNILGPKFVNTHDEFERITKDDIMVEYYNDIINKDIIRTNTFKLLDDLIDSQNYNNDNKIKAFEKAYEILYRDFIPKEIRIAIILQDKEFVGVVPKTRHFTFSNKYIERWNKKNIFSGLNTEEDLKKVERSKLTAGLRYDILKRDNFRCTICGRSAEDGVKLHVDHIKPISKGGLTTPDNLRTLCQDCNLGKSDKYNEEIDTIETNNNEDDITWDF